MFHPFKFLLFVAVIFFTAIESHGQIATGNEASSDQEYAGVFSYQLGYEEGISCLSAGVVAVQESVSEGFTDRANGKVCRLSASEQDATILKVNQFLQKKGSDTSDKSVLKDDLHQLPHAVGKNNSYLIGFHAFDGMKRTGFAPDTKRFMQGFTDAVNQSQPAFSVEVLADVQRTVESRLIVHYKKIAERNRQSELLSFKSKAGDLQKVEDGLYFRMIKPGTGDLLSEDDTAVIDYTATTLDGRNVDFTFGLPRPVTVAIGEGLMKGLRRAMRLMRAGGEYELLVASDLAFGDLPEQGIEPGKSLSLIVSVVGIEDFDKEGKRRE